MENIFNQQFLIELGQGLKSWLLSDLPGLVIVIILFILAFKVINVSFRKLKSSLIHRADKQGGKDIEETTKRINTITGITRGLVKIVLWALFIMMVMQKLGVAIGPLLASAGIIGLAIGFGAQELVRDFISGFFIILEDQVRTGDVAIINGTGGLVEKIELRTITLRDFAGTVHIVQNGKINTLSNMTKDWSAMVFDIGVAYKEDTQKVMDVMKQVGDELMEDPQFKDEIVEPIEVFGLNEFGNSALVIKARIKTKPIRQWGVGREYRKRLKEAFDLRNIEIPFPHTTVYWGEAINPLKLDLNDHRIDKKEQ